jgi:3-hydroxyisobutyrate dehydrogenase-like beta-hydroxyacid dehydrogenase
MRIGFIGIGAMEQPIAVNLLKAGYSVVVYNRTPARAEALRPAGAIVARSVREACQADVVMTMLSDDPAVEAVVFQSNEFLPCFDSARVHLSMGTIGVEMARKLTAAHAQHGGQFISAPVFGRPERAASGSLLILAAGPTAGIDQVSPILASIGKRLFVVGEEPFQANVLKLCGNTVLLSAIEAMAETMAFARKQGIQPCRFVEIMTETLFTAPLYKTYGSLMVNEVFKPAGFRLQLALKDAELLLDEAFRAAVPMSSASAVKNQLRAAVQSGLGDFDVAALSLLCSGASRIQLSKALRPGPGRTTSAVDQA